MKATKGCGQIGPNGYVCTHHVNGEHQARGIERGSFAESWPIHPKDCLRHHVTGAIERGEVVPIVEQRATMPDVGQLMAYENGELGHADILQLFADLVRSGLAWQLQGSYGRAAASLIERGYITRAGAITDAGRDACES